MDADLGSPFEGLPRPIDVFRLGSGEAADSRSLYFLRDSSDRLEIAGRAVRKAGLDDIYVEPGQLFSNHHFFFDIHAGPW